MEGALSRHCASRILRAMGWAYSWSIDRLVGQARRFARDRRTRKGVSQFSDIDVDLQCDRWRPLSAIDWFCDPRNLAHLELGPRDRRVDSSERRKIVSLSNDDSADQVRGFATLNRDKSYNCHKRGRCCNYVTVVTNQFIFSPTLATFLDSPRPRRDLSLLAFPALWGFCGNAGLA